MRTLVKIEHVPSWQTKLVTFWDILILVLKNPNKFIGYCVLTVILYMWHGLIVTIMLQESFQWLRWL